MYSSSYLCLQVISRLENHIILWLQLDWTTSRLLSFCCFIYIFPTFSSLSSWSEPSGSSTVTRMAAFPWQNSSTLCTSSPETDQTKNSFSSSKCTIWMVSWNSIFTPFHIITLDDAGKGRVLTSIWEPKISLSLTTRLRVKLSWNFNIFLQSLLGP